MSIKYHTMELILQLGVLATITRMSSAASTTTATETTGTPIGNGGGGLPVAGPSSAAVTTTPGYTYFFDDPHNQATYIVLPVMVLVYGGCAMIYCIAKCRRSCKKRARRKQQAQLIKDSHEQQQQNCFDNMSYNDDFSAAEYKRNNYEGAVGGTPTSPYEPSVGAAKPMLKRAEQPMSYNITSMPNSTEDPVINANIDTHLKNAFAMIEHAARDIKMQQALGLKSCPDRYPAEDENAVPIPKKTGYKQKYFIGV